MRTLWLILWLGTSLFGALNAQIAPKKDTIDKNINYQTIIRGRVVDAATENGLENAIVELMNFYPPKTAITDKNGDFVLEGAPDGRHRVLVNKEGYDEYIKSDILMTNKQDVLLENIGLNPLSQAQIEAQAQTSPNLHTEKIISKTDKDIPYNPMAGITARPFTVEEVTRYAGARFDLARLTNNFSGVCNNYDARNDIVIRGNSPAYTTWQVEELPVENPNHLAAMGTSGGTVPIVNIYALGKADFMKGSYSAQYGNSITGIFDLFLRKGNTQKQSLLAQIGTQRLEVLVEQPLFKSKDNGASLMFSVRTSLGTYMTNFLSKTLTDNPATRQQIRDWADPSHHDFNLKLDFGHLGANKRHELELFAIGGMSRLFIPYGTGALRDKIRYQIFETEDFLMRTQMFLVGFKHTYKLKHKGFWRNIIGESYHNYAGRWTDNPSPDLKITTYSTNVQRRNHLWHSYLQYRVSARFSTRIGTIANIYDLDLKQVYQLYNQIDQEYKGRFLSQRAYIQTRYNINPYVVLFAGFNSQYVSLGKHITAEPRLTFQFNLHRHHTFAIGGGRHTQMQHLQSKFYTPHYVDSLGNPQRDYSSYTAPPITSVQIDAEYNWLLSQTWRLKLQAYYQLLDNIMIQQDSSSFTMANTGISFFDSTWEPMKMGGKGRNKGVELTIEKFFDRQYYLLATATLFDSKTLASDGKWYNSVFNNRYILNVLAGKEFRFGATKNNILFTDFRFVTKGGRPYTPIDAEATYTLGQQNGGTDDVVIDSLTNAVFAPAFYQVDFKIGVRLNPKQSTRKHPFTHIFRIDLFNVFNIKNVYTYRYNQVLNINGAPVRGEVEPIYQRGFIPDITYTLQF